MKDMYSDYGEPSCEIYYNGKRCDNDNARQQQKLWQLLTEDDDICNTIADHDEKFAKKEILGDAKFDQITFIMVDSPKFLYALFYFVQDSDYKYDTQYFDLPNKTLHHNPPIHQDIPQLYQPQSLQ